MRKLQSRFETNGSRAIVVPRTFASDITGKYGSMKRGVRNQRAPLVYRTIADGKRKPVREKSPTIVRVQVVMPQPTPIVKHQETRVIRERVIIKEKAQNQPNVHRVPLEREKPDVRERIVERTKPVYRERIVERDKPPVVQERIVEREKPPVVQERIVEREKPPVVQERIVEREKPPVMRERNVEREKNPVAREQQGKLPTDREPTLPGSITRDAREIAAEQARPSLAQARVADIAGRIAEAGRSIRLISQPQATSNKNNRRQQISRILQEQLGARELAFRIVAEAADRIDNPIARVEEPTEADTPSLPNEHAGTLQPLVQRAAEQVRNMINARKGSKEPTIDKQRLASLPQQRVLVSPRRGESRPWSAIVMINRRNAERLKPLDKNERQHNREWKLTTQQQAIERYVTSRVVERVRESGEAAQGDAERIREMQISNREDAAAQAAQNRQAAEAQRRADTTQPARRRPLETQSSSEVDQATTEVKPHQSRIEAQRQGRAIDASIDKLEVDSQLLADEPSIEGMTVTMSGDLPASPSTPIRLQVVGTRGITVRLLSANAERLGSALFLRGRADSFATPLDVPSQAKLVLRRIAASTDTFVAARLASAGLPDRSADASVIGEASARDNRTNNRGQPGRLPSEAQNIPTAPTAPDNPSKRSTSNADRVPVASDSTAAAGASRMAITARTTVRRIAPIGPSKQPPRATSAGTIVHASQRWLAAVRRAERANRGHAVIAMPDQQSDQGSATVRAATPSSANQTLRRQREGGLNTNVNANKGNSTNGSTDNNAINNANASINNTNNTASISNNAGTLANQAQRESGSMSPDNAANAQSSPVNGSAVPTIHTTHAQPAASESHSTSVDFDAAREVDGTEGSGPKIDGISSDERSEPIGTVKVTKQNASRPPELVHRETGDDPQREDASRSDASPTTHRLTSQQEEQSSHPNYAGDVSAVDRATTESPARIRLAERSGATPTMRFTFRNRPSDTAMQAAAAIEAAQAAIATANAQVKAAEAASAQARAAEAAVAQSAATAASANPSDIAREAAAARRGHVAARTVGQSRPDEEGLLGQRSQQTQRTRATLVVRRDAAARPRNATLIQRATATRLSATAAARIANLVAARRGSPIAARMTRERAPMTMLTHPEAIAQPDEEAAQPLAATPSLAPLTTLRRQQQPAASRPGTKSAAAIPAPAAMELRRSVAPQTNAPPEPTPAVVTVEAPPQIDAKQLQKAIESLPQLNPDQLADKVYTALMKKMKFEQRLRGY